LNLLLVTRVPGLGSRLSRSIIMQKTKESKKQNNLLEKALELGLKESEFEKIKELLRRDPSITELAMYSVMWSEHCAYKHSRLELKKLPTKSERVLQGPGENAGIIDIGDGLAVAIKVESHNHPSAVEPFQGAATGVGGIVRDIFTMGARPVASMNSLRFGKLKNARQKYLLEGVVAGIGFYGNTIGVPTIGGEIYFEDAYEGNCLVNAMCIGLLEKDKIIKAQAKGAGNLVVLMGSKTGRDGIGGASVLASQEFDESSAKKRPSVQVGDPFMEKLLIEACLELRDKELIVAMQDFGAAGLTCSTCEMSSSGDVGMEVDLDKVPKREENMQPFELMMSESQERMMAIVEPEKLDEFIKVCEKWQVPSSVIGEVKNHKKVRIYSQGKVVADSPALTYTEESPIYKPKAKKPAYLDELEKKEVKLGEPEDYNQALIDLISSENICSRRWVWQQYDYMVQTNTALAYGADASVIRIKGTKKALAVSIDGQGRYCYLDPFEGSKITVAEAARNLVMAGAKPLAVTDCLNFGNPEKEKIFWQFSKSIEGIAEACKYFKVPVVSGNVSFYNESSKANGKSLAVFPTPVIGMVGLIEDLDHFTTIGFKDEGDLVYLLGETLPEFGGSEYLRMVDGIYGKPPALDFEKEAALHEFCQRAIKQGIIKSAHDLSDGGLGVSLVESALANNKGADIEIKDDLFTHLFSESQSRALVTISPEDENRFEKLADDIKITKLGAVNGNKLEINGKIGLALDAIADTYNSSLEKALKKN